MFSRDLVEGDPSVYMELHAESMFTYDPGGRMRAANEPWPGEAPAPRFFLGRPARGAATCRYRYDVPEALARQLARWSADEPAAGDGDAKPKHLNAYLTLLESERWTMGPCYEVPSALSPSLETVSLRPDQGTEWLQDGFDWLVSELDYAQPCVALVRDGMAVSVCRSVRIGERAHEAGLETLEAYRGRGYAAAVVARWASEVRERGAIPLYSTMEDNSASRRVASKLGLLRYGSHLSVY
ncbi:GNAT family N-acetyltransferase [Cohnella sp. REN36]|uniref:GNAT family N-acetyltransferase n=1 Tax=Cohnella sp. REN36 TaxID=2887347 RepID=UPI001D145C93|nr:GNAT family N-acetyltransferase [Cohnella sp. REN36]MCC3374581.1 GNAT family N-acetyltransferase [Cohnella sp. REN36]